MPKFEKLSSYFESQAAVIPAAHGTGAVSAIAVDATGCDRVQYVIALGAFATGAGFDCELTESATSGGTYTLITGSGITAVTSTAANKLIIVDAVVNGSKPFQKIRGTIGTAAIGLSAIAQPYNGTRISIQTAEDVQETVIV